MATKMTVTCDICGVDTGDLLESGRLIAPKRESMDFCCLCLPTLLANIELMQMHRKELDGQGNAC